jgi:hypothetical protein
MVTFLFMLLFWLLAMFFNSLMDAIDFTTTVRLGHGWHIIKWIFFVPSLFFSGFFAREFVRENNLGWWKWSNWYFMVIIMIVLGVLIWQWNYHCWVKFFQIFGVP